MPNPLLKMTPVVNDICRTDQRGDGLRFFYSSSGVKTDLESLALHFVHMVLNQEGNVDGMEIFKYLWDEFNVRNLADWRDVRVRPQDHKQVEFAAETNRLLVQLLRKHLKLFDREGDRESKTVITFCLFMMNALIVNNQRVTNGFKVRLRLLQSDVEQIEEFFKKEPGQGLIDDQAYLSWYRLEQSGGYDIVATELPYVLGDFMGVPKTMRADNHRDRASVGLNLPKQVSEESLQIGFKKVALDLVDKTIDYEKLKKNLINTGALPQHCQINDYNFDALVRTCTTVANVYQKLVDDKNRPEGTEQNQKTAWQLKAERIRQIKAKATRRKRKNSWGELGASEGDKAGSSGADATSAIAARSSSASVQGRVNPSA